MKIKATAKKSDGSSAVKAVIKSKARPGFAKKSEKVTKRKETIKKPSAIKKVGAEWKSFTVVAIGASAGGLEAVTQFLQQLSPTTGMAYIYVQHLSPDHKSILPALLSKVTKMKVQDVEDMEKMRPNNVYVIPYNSGIKVTDGHIKLIPRTSTTALSIDVLFTSLAETHKENVIGIVLSGSGSDGTIGLRAIKNAGGITFAQDDSAKFGSMPNSAISERAVDFVLSPVEIARKLTWMSKHPLLKRRGIKNVPEDEIDNDNPLLKTILQLLLQSKNVDFSCYKMNTVKRRLLRRMLFHKMTGLKEYVSLLQQSQGEIDLLYQDMLINVTEFFRDPEAFMLLKKSVLPQLIRSKGQGESLRIWVAACATGEETYSLAMLLCELQGTMNSDFSFQIFASDLSPEAISIARNGEYSRQQLENVSNQRLQRFFTKSKDKFRITKVLRDVCIFAPHNILRDPPFSKMDFISCRNLLIYLDVAAQKKVIGTFHYALNEKGCLMLGKSETIGSSPQLFTTSVNKKFKIYIRKKNTATNKLVDLTPSKWRETVFKKNGFSAVVAKKAANGPNGQVGAAFDSLLLSQYAPASVVINHDLEIVQFRGPTSLYLRNPEGKASLNILKMAHPEIIFELRNAIHHAIKSKQRISKTGIEMKPERSRVAPRIINLEVVPLKLEGEENLLVVVFTAQQQTESLTNSEKGGKNNAPGKDRRIAKLEEEIASARFDMASITQDQEAANEELQSANEEIVSSNEELQSLNEELETSKEEIESTNEELITTNQELQARNQQVEELYGFYEAILTAIYEPMLILYADMRIKSANRSFLDLFKVVEDEITGISLFKLGNGKWNIPKLRDLLEGLIAKNDHFENYEVELSFQTIGKRSFLLNAHRIVKKSQNLELIVLTISDITQIKRLANEIKDKERKMLEVKLEIEQEALKKIAENNRELVIARKEAENKTEIAEQAVKSKQRFLANMSHEIRTPMNAIIGFTNVVLKTKLDEAQREYLHAIKVSGDALIVLINDILDLAKVDAGKMTFESTTFNLSESISSMLRLFEVKIQEKNLLLVVKIDPKVPEIVIGDPMRLRQIFLNLLSNAVKFTNQGTLTVNVQVLESGAGKIKLQILVIDTGIGIPENRKSQIFNSFEQAGRETSRSFGGTGLGLAISKQLVELQGGTIFMESKEGVGSTFGFTLNMLMAGPQTLKENKMTAASPFKFQGIKGLKVLMVEDVALNQLLLKIILSDFGFDYDVAKNGQVAVDYLVKNHYDVVLMDLQMPVMDGFEATNFIRKEMKSQIPIIALSADVTSIDVEKCIQAGMNDYVSKPIDEKLLYTKILKCVSEHNPLILQK